MRAIYPALAVCLFGACSDAPTPDTMDVTLDASVPGDARVEDAAPMVDTSVPEADGSAREDDANVSAGPSVADIPRDTTFAAIDDAQAQALCRWQQERVSTLGPTLRDACTLAAAASTSSESACASQVATCVGAGSLGGESGDCSGIRADGLPATCGVLSLGEYGDCVVTALTERKARLSAVTCAQAGSVTASEATLPAPCANVETHCRVLLP